jgi:hemerythrin-like metal-binding protein
MFASDALPRVNSQLMNDLHLAEIGLINDLLKHLDNDADFITITGKTEAILDHMQKHFEEEERLMGKSSYPSLAIHKAEHDRTLSEVRFICMDWRTRKERHQLRRYFEEDIAGWFGEHIQTMDAPAAAFISLNG